MSRQRPDTRQTTAIRSGETIRSALCGDTQILYRDSAWVPKFLEATGLAYG